MHCIEVNIGLLSTEGALVRQKRYPLIVLELALHCICVRIIVTCCWVISLLYQDIWVKKENCLYTGNRGV